MPGSTGVQPFKRKQREEGKGRIETAGGQQKEGTGYHLIKSTEPHFGRL